MILCLVAILMFILLYYASVVLKSGGEKQDNNGHHLSASHSVTEQEGIIMATLCMYYTNKALTTLILL